MMEFSQGDTKSFVCTALGTDLAKAAMTEPRDSIFDLNVRPFYGSKGKVNKDIWITCTGVEAVRFWFLNNGSRWFVTHSTSQEIRIIQF